MELPDYRQFSAVELRQELNQMCEHHEKRGDAGESTEREREGPCTVQNLDLLGAAQVIEPAALSRPNIAKFVDDGHLALL